MIDMQDVKLLLSSTDERTLTLYLNVNNAHPENQADTPAWSIWLRNTLRELEETLQDADAAAFPYVRDWVNAQFADYAPSSKAIAVFASGSYQQIIELPFAFENEAYFGNPFVAPLLWAIDEYEPYLIALVDQEKARFFVTYFGSIGFQGGTEVDIADYDFVERTVMPNPSVGIDGRTGAVHGGTGKDDHQRMLDEHRARMFRDVVDQIDKLAEKHGARRVILGGTEEYAHAVRNLMSDKQKERIVGIFPIPVRANMPQIAELAQPAAEQYEREGEVTLVEQVIDFARSRGRGAIGRQDVRDALDMQRVELLIVSYPLPDAEIEDLAFRALQLNSQIELVRGKAADLINEVGGVAARLYYAL